ncbi:hypothetical protein C7974DRAFT_434037 [Boeremia exigua]|uniref:uncharacterized protein n=1 Tax=Boeremia exigua TaxID=749465 RepID=UPI001E8CDE30|nr:uncharacterized protein C7974DRAFT_434037 [Boeremia exigua]KAH6629492.1 hypothetical protein C7974DRAFT_434037 [Boeremia exigua]
MPAPLAKGLIIAASVLVAAGIAIYENPQVRQWVDQSRRKIAVALHSLGDDIQPRRQSESSDDYEERKRRRDELIRMNRNELIRRAREEGIAVDLDELAKIGTEDTVLAEQRSRANRSKSFDELVGSDGMLRQDGTTTGTDITQDGLRKRGVAGFAAGTAAAAAMSNPFADDNVLFDIADDDEAPSPKPFIYEEPTTRSRSATIEAQTPPIEAPVEPSVPLIDLTSEPQSVYLHPETQLPSPAPLQASEIEQGAQSFYSFTSSNDGDQDFEHMSAGTLTPRSERSGTTGASIVPSHADDVAVLSMQNDADHDARSEVFSESGFTDAGYSDFELGDRTGVMTPNSWTDVGSDNESEWGGPQGNGQVSQIHQ